MTTSTNISRRGAISALAAFTATPSIALPAVVEKTVQPQTNIDLLARFLWIERQTNVELLFRVSAEHKRASEKLPAWAKTGFDSIDQDGNPCGSETGWPLDTSIEPPPLGRRLVRVSLWQCRQDFYTTVRILSVGTEELAKAQIAMRSKARAAMRARMRRVIALWRERDRLYQDLGLIDLDRQSQAICKAIISLEDTIAEQELTPNIVAAKLMITLGEECDRSSRAIGNEYSTTMSMALVVLQGLLPNLSGLIKTHAAFFVSNPDLPLSEMPFVAC
jgi:hypothetical protein